MPYADLLTDAELSSALAGLPDWSRDGSALTRTVEVKGFRAAVALVNAIAEAAEAANHHPDVCIHDYKKVTLTLTTHAAGGITRRDVDLAAEIDRLAR